MMLSPRWTKVLRDIWDNKSRTVLVVLAIAVGVFAFGGVFITRDVLITDMNAGFQSAHPSSINIGVGDFDENDVRSVSGLREVEQAEGRISTYIQLVIGDQKYNMQVYARRDYENMQLNLVTPEAGEWPPGRREIVLERTALPVIGKQIGDTVTVELTDGQQYDLDLVGTVHDLNAIPASLFPILTGYLSVETLQWMGLNTSYSELNIVPVGGITDTDALEKIGVDLTKRLEREGYGVGGFSVQDPTRHWGADTTEGFTLILSVIGFFALLLSGLLVVNTISAVLTQQKRQIGMMKAIGAVRGHIFGIYITMVLVFGALALFVAFPLGWGVAWLSTQAVANFLNIDILNFRYPLWVAAMETATGLIVPVLAALVPVMGGALVTVREAVSDYGIGKKAPSGLVDRLMARVRGLPRPTMLSLRNTFRRKGRLILTLSTLTLAGAMFVAVISVRDSLMVELDNILKLYGYNFQIGLDDAYPINTLKRVASRVDGITTVEGWAFAQPQIIREDGSEGESFTLYGPPADTPFVEPTLKAGRWLEPGDQNAIVIASEMLRDESGIEVGDEIVLKIGENKRRWQVVGIVVSTESSAYANFDYLSRIQGAPGQAFVLLAGTEQSTAQYEETVMRALEERLKRSGIGVGFSLTTSTIIGANVSQFDFLIIFLLVSAIFLAVVGGLGLAGTMSLNVLERTREIGVMRAIGAGNAALSGVVMTEGITIGLISWALGGILAVPGSLAFSAALGNSFFERPLPFTFSFVGVGLWLVVVMFISAIASLLPARRASRVSVREALAYE